MVKSLTLEVTYKPGGKGGPKTARAALMRELCKRLEWEVPSLISDATKESVILPGGIVVQLKQLLQGHGDTTAQDIELHLHPTFGHPVTPVLCSASLQFIVNLLVLVKNLLTALSQQDKYALAGCETALVNVSLPVQQGAVVNLASGTIIHSWGLTPGWEGGAVIPDKPPTLA